MKILNHHVKKVHKTQIEIDISKQNSHGIRIEQKTMKNEYSLESKYTKQDKRNPKLLNGYGLLHHFKKKAISIAEQIENMTVH